MARKVIGAFWDRNNLLDLNDDIEELYNQKDYVTRTLNDYKNKQAAFETEANKLINVTKYTQQQNQNVQQQINDLIIDKGKSDAEVIQARGNYSVLNERLTSNENELMYLSDRPKLNNGLLKLPSSFPNLPFNIYRKDAYNYTHDATPYNQFDWSNATEIFISENRILSNDGLTFDKPVDGAIFSQNLTNGVYGNQTKFIFTLIDNIYTSVSALQFQTSGVKHLLVRSGAVSGKTIIGRVKRIGKEASEWSKYESIYKLSLIDGTTHPIADIVNTKDSIEDTTVGFYNLVGSVDEVKANKGTFYQSGVDIYCNPYPIDDIKCLMPVTTQNMLPIKADNETLMFQNLYLTTSSTQFKANTNGKLYFFNCKFLRGDGNDGFAVSGSSYKAFLFDCVSMFAAKDGFNYHSTTTDSLAVEVNCKSFANGKYKRATGNQTTHSNNGSTAHDGMNILRVGSHYWDCEGPVVADVNDCFSISVGVKVGSILKTSTGYNDAFHLSSENGAPTKPKYVLESNAYGSNIKYGIDAPQGNAFYLDFVGNTAINNAQKITDWGV